MLICVCRKKLENVFNDFKKKRVNALTLKIILIPTALDFQLPTCWLSTN